MRVVLIRVVQSLDTCVAADSVRAAHAALIR